METRAASLDADRATLPLVRRLRVVDAWMRVHVAHAALQIAQAGLRLADELARASARGAELGELTRADAADAFAYGAEAKLNVLSSKGELIDARLDMTGTLAVTDHALDARGDPPSRYARAAQ
jgi:outer membrane protein TolC